MVEEDRVDISEEINPLAPTLSQPPPTHALPPSTPAGILPAYSGAPPAHLPPLASSGALHAHTSQTPSASEDQARIAALEGTVNQLATSMAANMAKLFALLKGSNRASLSSTPPPGPGPMADPTLWAPPIQAPENIEVPAPPTLHTSTVHPFTSQFLPPPAPTAVPLPPTTFLSSKHVLSAPPPVSIPAPAMAYTVPPPMVFLASSALASTHLQAAELPPYPSLQPHTGLSYQAPPPINTTFHEPGTPTHAAQFTSPTHFFPEADAEQERRLKRMEETIRALQAGDARPDARYGDYSLFPGMRLPPKFKVPEFKTYEGTTDPRHHLRHYRGKMLQMEDPTSKGEESSKKAPAAPSSSGGRRAKEVSVNAVNTAHQAPQQYSVNLTTTPTTAPTYFPPPPQHQPQSIYYSAPPVPPPATSQPYDHFAPTSAQPSQPRPPVSRAPPPAQQNSTSQGQQAGGTQSRPRKQYSPLPAPLSHIYQQLLAGNQIRPISPSPNFDPSVQDQSKHCEYHQGASGHTLDNCWRLRDEIQRRIDSNRLTFNAVKPPNVQANPLPDYRSNSGPSINMISICASGRDEEAQEKSPPFLVNYTPEELIVGLTGHVASPAPFVVDIPAREPYSDSKVP
ncbi:leucine-rich repeat extensin-like protein 5 [Punica granatum]|uniref:Leucine-rich repeat extensin-like protein 5 n=1 Tax=Punica granatum TaxID=22663 RepID=A0A6P8DKX3_PUNGR|nr:leucine-rich repeat extensin-like protein 5 [Punica granatum]